MEYKRVEIAIKPELEDPLALHVLWEIKTSLSYSISNLRIVTVYTIYSDLDDERILNFTGSVLNDPVTSIFSIGSPIALRGFSFDWAIEVSFKPGVTDNVGHTAKDVLKMMVSAYRKSFDPDRYEVYKSTQYLISSDLKLDEVQRICKDVLYNELIEEINILNYRDFLKLRGFPLNTRALKDNYTPMIKTFNLNIPDYKLLELSRERVLALSLDEMKYFREYFHRDEVKKEREKAGIGTDPTDVELECFAQTQSEHCKHKIFNATITYSEGERTEIIKSLFNTYIKAATKEIGKGKDFLISVFKDNAGIMEFNDDYNLAFKVETHNTPSALDPYGGSITGIVGVDRDPAGTGIGSRLVAHTDVLCFGDPNYSGELPPRMMHPKRIMEGVIKGIEDGGNKCGIPTINGAVIFDQSYSGKPLVFCGSIGIMPKKIGGRLTCKKYARPGDVIVMVGGRIGKDGIHGATFSSEEIKETSPTQAVQIGDPITQKKMLDMLLEARDRLLYRGITDNGAGGLSSSVGEMALLSGGARLELEKAPLKYEGLDPWEILLSEAQERMTLAVPEDKLKAFLSLAERRDVLAVPLGEFTDSGYFKVTYDGKTVCYLNLKFLHSNIPFFLEAHWEEPDIQEKNPKPGKPIQDTVMEIISDINSCSREPLLRRYDHEVQGTTIIKPLMGRDEIGPSDGGVIAPIPGEIVGFVLSAGINPFYSRVDTYHMAAIAVDEALRNAVVVGADPERVALLDNFCWPDPVYDEKKTPDGKYKLAQLVRAVKGLYDTALAYKSPFISGKDSMKNDYKIGEYKISVLPTILVSLVGIVPDYRKCVTSDFKNKGDLIYLLGKTGKHLGESLYYRKYGGKSKNIPTVNPDENMAIYRAYFNALNRGLIVSGHDLSEGGLAISLVESCIAGNRGADIELGLMKKSEYLTEEELLFSESSGRILVSVNPGLEEDFQNLMVDIPAKKIGVVTDKKLIVRGKKGEVLLSKEIEKLTDSYRKPLYEVLGMEK